MYIKSQNNKVLSEADNRKLLLQLSSALKYLHANAIAHRDLKMENILGEFKFLVIFELLF